MNLKETHGFSLIEVLIALVILAVGFLALLGMQIASTKGSFFSNNITQATVHAQNKLEVLRNLSYDDPELNIGISSEQLIANSGLVFQRESTVTLLGNWIKRITVKVAWSDRVEHEVSLSTIKAR